MVRFYKEKKKKSVHGLSEANKQPKGGKKRKYSRLHIGASILGFHIFSMSRQGLVHYKYFMYVLTS